MIYSEMLNLSKSSFKNFDVENVFTYKIKKGMYLKLYVSYFTLQEQGRSKYESSYYNGDYEKYLDDLIIFKELILPRYL